MMLWTDPFTKLTYKLTGEWQQLVRKHLAEMIAEEIRERTTAKAAADRCATFWLEYYSLVFPLRFGGKKGEQNRVSGIELSTPQSDFIELNPVDSFRNSFLDGQLLPPLLTSQTQAQELIADHHLICAALANIVMRAKGMPPDLIHQIRLGILLHELCEMEVIRQVLQRDEFQLARQVAQFLHSGVALPDELQPDLLSAIHSETIPDNLREQPIHLIGIGAQRIKQYVFESPGLNEIRGASTLLDWCIEQLKEKVSQELGPEVILRAAASTLEFLAPTAFSEQDQEWVMYLKKFFYDHTHTAFVAAAATETSLSEVFTNFGEISKHFHQAIESDRYHSELPETESLPFELRCQLCRARPAEKLYPSPEGNRAYACRACYRKRALGRKGRVGKIQQVLEWLHLGDPMPLGVKNVQASKYTAQDLEQLMPDNLSRNRIAVIYGDGNNFGQVIPTLNSLSRSLQWTHRVEKTTQAAAALALARATQEITKDEKNPISLERVPFQVLALGGDDLSLLAWGRIGLRFCEQFLHLTDLEFQPSANAKPEERLSFSIGALFCDEKSPVRRTVDFAENDLLKWAKRAVQNQPARQGNVAFLLANTPEQIPTDLESYREQMFVRQGHVLLRNGKLTSNDSRLYLTLRPFIATELNHLLEKAQYLIKGRHTGQLHRLTEVFVQSPPGAAILHYLYQKQREQQQGLVSALEKDHWGALFQVAGFTTKKNISPVFPAKTLPRKSFGEESNAPQAVDLFTPLWDLLELVKILS